MQYVVAAADPYLRTVSPTAPRLAANLSLKKTAKAELVQYVVAAADPYLRTVSPTALRLAANLSL